MLVELTNLGSIAIKGTLNGGMVGKTFFFFFFSLPTYHMSFFNVSNSRSNEPGVQEAETLHMGLLEKLSLLLPKFSSAQQELEDTLNDVVALRRLCNRNNISPGNIIRPPR